VTRALKTPDSPHLIPFSSLPCPALFFFCLFLFFLSVLFHSPFSVLLRVVFCGLGRNITVYSW